MKNKSAIIIFLCLQILIHWLCKAQNQHTIDSLINVLKTAKEDTNKVHLLMKISNQYMNSNPEPMLAYDEQALSLSEKLHFAKGKILSLNAIAIYYYFSNDLVKALEYAKRNIKIAEDDNNTEELFKAYNTIASIYDAQGEFKMATPFRLKTLVMAEKLHDPELIASSNANFGINYESLGNYTEALIYYFKSLKVREEQNDSLRLPNSYGCIGDVYSRINDFVNGKKFHLKSLSISEKTNNVREMINSYFRLGEIEMEENNLAQAKKYFSDCLSRCSETNDLHMTAGAYQGLGEVSDKEEKYDRAMEYHRKALTIFQEIGDKMGISEATRYIGIEYLKKKDFSAALSYFQSSRTIADSIGFKPSLVSIYKNISETYEKMHDYKMAYKYSILHKDLADSVLNEETANKMIEMREKYDSENKEQKIILLTKDKEIQNVEIKKQKLLKNSFIVGLALLGLLSFFVYHTIRTRQKLKLQTLRNKIASDLHDDVGSTLSSIALFSDVTQHKSKDVMMMLQSINESSRKMLESMADIVWTINPENDNFEKIILRMRSFAYELLGAKKIDFDFKVDDAVSQTKLSMAARKNLYLIFKEAINNLVKYSEANRASFSITGSKNSMTMLIRDNGKGFDIEKITQGNGLKNMQKRALEIGAKFIIESEPGTGTTIQLILTA